MRKSCSLIRPTDAERTAGKFKMYMPWTNEVTLAEACRRCGLDEAGRELLSLVQTGRLILYGHVGTNDRCRVQCHQVEKVTPSISAASSEKDEYSDVVAVPALRSASRIDVVAGHSLSEVFRDYILGDPEVIALSREAIRVKPELDRIFHRGWYTSYGVREWPVSLEHSFLGGIERLSAFGFLRDPEPAAAIDAIDALQDRFVALLTMLQRNEIEAYGLPSRPGDPQDLMRSLWAHRDIEIDPLKGDVFSQNPECENPHFDRLVKRWTGVMFRRTNRGKSPSALIASGSGMRDTFHVNFTDDAHVRPGRSGRTNTPSISDKRTPQRESIKAAIAALWPSGIPVGLPVQRRDQKIIEWQKTNGRAIVSAKSISRFLARL